MMDSPPISLYDPLPETTELRGQITHVGLAEWDTRTTTLWVKLTIRPRDVVVTVDALGASGGTRTTTRWAALDAPEDAPELTARVKLTTFIDHLLPAYTSEQIATLPAGQWWRA